MFPQHNFSNFSAVPSLKTLLLNLYANLQLPDNQFPSFHPNTVMVDYREIQQARNLGHLNRMFQLQTSRDHREIRRLPEYPEIHHSNIPYGIALSQYELFNDFNFATRWEVRQPTFGIPRYRTTEEMTQIRFDFARNGRSTDRMQDHFPPLPRNVNLEPFWTVGDCQRMQSTNGRSQWPRVDLTATNSKQGSEMSNTCRSSNTSKHETNSHRSKNSQGHHQRCSNCGAHHVHTSNCLGETYAQIGKYPKTPRRRRSGHRRSSTSSRTSRKSLSVRK